MALRGQKDWDVKLNRELDRAKRHAVRELEKIEPELRAIFDALESSVKKHPRQAAIVALSIGAALGATGMHLVRRKKKRS